MLSMFTKLKSNDWNDYLYCQVWQTIKVYYQAFLTILAVLPKLKQTWLTFLSTLTFWSLLSNFCQTWFYHIWHFYQYCSCDQTTHLIICMFYQYCHFCQLWRKFWPTMSSIDNVDTICVANYDNNINIDLNWSCRNWRRLFSVYISPKYSFRSDCFDSKTQCKLECFVSLRACGTFLSFIPSTLQ